MAFPLNVQGCAHHVHEPIIARVTTSARSIGDRAEAVFLDPGHDADVAGYAGILLTRPLETSLGVPVVHSLPYRDHLEDGDVVAVQPSGYVRTLYKRSSPHNTLFATDRCNSFCLMCSQPPKKIDDRDRIHEHLRLIRLIDPAPRELGITGGEPTLLGRGFLRLIAACRDCLPTTALHVLTNGRLFRYQRFAADLAAIQHPELVLGIPVYSDLDYEHDYVVQARGAFADTLLGIHHLAHHGLRVEIRVVLHRLTYQRLPDLAAFLYRNLTFADHIALMGLELTGFTIPNLDTLWIDPFEYQDQLAEATLYLAARGMAVSIYNHQLCVLPQRLWPYARQSISDWKNAYLPQCATCAVRDMCGGFFSSATRRRISAHIHAIAPT